MRKASQQSQALRRELNNTMKKAKEDFKKRNEQAMENLNKKVLEDQGITLSQNPKQF